jgi:hypothetical protein
MDASFRHITVISSVTDSVINTVALAPQLIGFKSDRSTLAKVVFDAALVNELRGRGIDRLSSAVDRAKLVKFLKSIDLTTAPFPKKSINEAKALCLP